MLFYYVLIFRLTEVLKLYIILNVRIYKNIIFYYAYLVFTYESAEGMNRESSVLSSATHSHSVKHIILKNTPSSPLLQAQMSNLRLHSRLIHSVPSFLVHLLMFSVAKVTRTR